MEIESRVIIVKNIPHGFYEKEMLEFFSQFGKVTRLRLLRSKKYLNSKGIAFVEFAYEDVAKIAAHTMNNYLMFEKLIKCELIAPSQLPKGVFRNWKGKKISTIVRHKTVSGRIRDDTEWNKLKNKKMKLINKTLNQLKDLGIEYKCTIVEDKVDDIPTDLKKSNSISNGHIEDSGDDTFVTADSSPVPRKLSPLSEIKLSSKSKSGMRRKLFSLPKFAILRAARRLSL